MATIFDNAPDHRTSFAADTPHQIPRPKNYPDNVPHHLEYPQFPAWGLLDRAALLMPGRMACHYNDLEWTWEELNQDAMRAAAMLRRLGVKPGDRVGILLPNVPEYLIALNGIWRAGAVAVAISPMSVAEEVESQLAATECGVVICLDMLSSVLVGQYRPRKTLFVSLRSRLPLFEQLGYLYLRKRRTGSWWMREDQHAGWFWTEMQSCSPSDLTEEIDPATTPAYILPTGGTTGAPKAVTLSHRNLVANAWQQYYWAGGVPGQEKLMAVLPFFHSYGLSTNVLGGAAMVSSMILHHRFNPRQVIRSIERHQPTVFHTVPAMLVAMNEYLRSYPADLSSLKWVISGGASLPETVGREFAEYTGAMIVEGYGLSEASPVTHVGPLDGSARYGTIGLPLPDTACRIVDPDSDEKEVADGEIGELLVRGPQVMLGYWKNPQETAATIRDGWLRTGDMARRNSEGLYQIVERLKDIIITSGMNVYPQEVEHVLRQHPAVLDAAVVGVPDLRRGELVKAFIVIRPGAVWNESELNEFCGQHLATFRRPRLFEQCDGDLPRSFLGKVIRRKLRKPAVHEPSVHESSEGDES